MVGEDCGVGAEGAEGMTPAEASKLRVGDRCWFQADMLVTGLPNGIYEVLDMTDTIMGGRRSVRIKLCDDPETWARPGNVSRVAREQRGKT